MSDTLKSILPTAEKIDINPVPIMKYQIENPDSLCAELKKVILKRKEQHEGIEVSNVGGWHSSKDLETWDAPCIRELTKHIQNLVKEMVLRTVKNPTEEHLTGWTIESWANVSGAGASNRSHDHGYKNMWSGFMSVDSGFGEESKVDTGFTKLEDRSGTANEMIHNKDPFSREYCVKPQKGLMLLFPATLKHYVEPYKGKSVRISIAYNLKHRPGGFVIPKYPDTGQKSWLWINFRFIMRALQLLGEALGLRKKDPYQDY